MHIFNHFLSAHKSEVSSLSFICLSLSLSFPGLMYHIPRIGIGRAITHSLVARGCHVLAVGYRLETLNECKSLAVSTRLPIRLSKPLSESLGDSSNPILYCTSLWSTWIWNSEYSTVCVDAVGAFACNPDGAGRIGLEGDRKTASAGDRRQASPLPGEQRGEYCARALRPDLWSQHGQVCFSGFKSVGHAHFHNYCHLNSFFVQTLQWNPKSHDKRHTSMQLQINKLHHMFITHIKHIWKSRYQYCIQLWRSCTHKRTHEFKCSVQYFCSYFKRADSRWAHEARGRRSNRKYEQSWFVTPAAAGHASVRHL